MFAQPSTARTIPTKPAAQYRTLRPSLGPPRSPPPITNLRPRANNPSGPKLPGPVRRMSFGISREQFSAVLSGATTNRRPVDGELLAVENSVTNRISAGCVVALNVDTQELPRTRKQKLVISSSYLNNGISRNRWATKFEGAQLLTGTLPTSWITGPAVVNAFYAPTLNSISFPAAILQPPFLGSEYPDYWNFGAVGMVIGHEITHGFDDRGSQFGADGSFSNWWDPQSRANFRERADGLVYQYGNYTLMGQQLNGVLTQGENIADNGGMKEAFYGYKNYIAAGRNGTSQDRLPGLSYTPEQLFFLANAQVWCSDFRPTDLANQIRTGAHSPGRFRVIGPMQNFDEFSKAYSCPLGSYMNPVQKNPVW
ncbi:Neprilysin [Hypsibius exemplaris]|uniref:Neprilysin n=1 Tax=Hypsibius exemplaris TaxID=2072580 RepID=A0A1W0WJ70_HYPEX|nr:Neprilysin [Hypsibius exemplaris]